MSSVFHLLSLGLFVIQFTESQNISKYIQEFSTEIKSLFCGGLSVGGDKCSNQAYGIQDFIASFANHFEDDIEDTSIITKQIIDRLDKKLNLRASFLKNLTATIQQSCIKYAYDYDSDIESIPDFDQLKFSGNTERDAYLPHDVEYNAVYGNAVSLSQSTYKLPNGVDYNNENIQKDAQISVLLEDIMIDLYDNYCIDAKGNEEYCQMYFGTINGVFRVYPGVENVRDTNGAYSSYDPRFRPWYVSAASGPKDVILLIDRSGSMKDSQRLDIAKQAVISVLKTLGSSSFVSVVAFNHKSELSCFNTELVPATKRNVDELIDFVSGLNAEGNTNFSMAFDTVFTILENGAQSCQTSILFLTDGIADDVSKMIQKRNTDDIGAVVFSYTLGADAAPDIPRKIASLTNGIYTHIDDEDTNLITVMSSYYLYYAYGSQQENNIIITSPYLDFDTKLPMVTMAKAVYFNSTYFVGVVGIDIPLDFLSDAVGDVTIGRKSYSFVVNQESELILHPAIADPLTTLFANDEYKAVYIADVEPNELNDTVVTLLTTRQSGTLKIEALTTQSAGNVAYNGYVSETANLLYVYSGVGPSSLSLVIVIYTDADTEAPHVKGFGFKGSPNTDCAINATQPSNCVAPFNLYDHLDVMKACNVSWIGEAEIMHSATKNSSVSFKYPSWYLQAGCWESAMDAIDSKPTCSEIEALHKVTNRLGFVTTSELPFDGFRSEISSKILNSIYTMPSLAQFWKSSFLSTNSTFFAFYFASYQGLMILYPAQQVQRTYNPLIRPWYQRAISYPNLFVFTTPYIDAFTGQIVASGATSIMLPNVNSIHSFGVAGFDYQFNEFISYWNNIMSDICNQKQKQYCYLVDSSAFLLYYDGIQAAVANSNDDTISIKFFGDFEPTLMQSLIDKGFFAKETNTNFEDDTINIAYIANDEIYSEQSLDSMATSFDRNSGLYSLHMIAKTNLYVIYIENYHQTDIYPHHCPYDDDCSSVESPGCVISEDSSQCQSATIDVCIEADSPATTGIDSSCSASSGIDNFGICILKTDEESDICASNFNVNACENTAIDGWTQSEKIIYGCLFGVILLFFLIIAIACFCFWFSRRGDGGKPQYEEVYQ